ncbi:hypothetical protein MKW94_020040 [Papaver nudicaule]|uniref:MORF/ORRM1/DAG-like MORF domain-containing protein n=1 Tax=Papaver nudicaule TaxID=74823 RepID=A0AA42AYA2_PAPNU|nr:hypothetical protein [Papaver nudicaule]
MAIRVLVRRTLSLSSSSSSPSFLLCNRVSHSILEKLNEKNILPEPRKIPVRFKTSGSGGYSPLNDPSPNWSNRPPKESILLDGCDYEHWLIVLEFTGNPKPSEDEMISAYVKTLTSVLGSEEEAKKKIYSVSTSCYTGFGALISQELSEKVKEQPGVLWVLPDSYLDVPNKDYGGDLFVDGKVIHRPQFNYSNNSQISRQRPRPRYDSRRQGMQVARNEQTQSGPVPAASRPFGGQDSFQNGERDPSMSPGQFSQQRGPVPAASRPLGGQNSFQNGGRDPSMNPGQFNQGRGVY